MSKQKALVSASAADRTDISLAREAREMLGYDFQRPELLVSALTHSSWANEAQHGAAHNERQEFLGDAVLELCVSTGLYQRYPLAREGDLTRMRVKLVNCVTLARLARSLGLDQLLRLGAGEEKQGGRSRDAVLCDAFEAVLAAIYEDGGFNAALNFVDRIFADYWPEQWHEERISDAKSRLQELSHQLFRACPVYALENVSGPEHAKIFTVSLLLPNGQTFRASNSSCKKAEQDAAAIALERLAESAP